MGGCLGCCTKPLLVISVDEPSKGLEIQGQRLKKHSLTEDFWSPSSGDMDNSGLPSHRSASSISTSNQTLDTNGSTGGPSNSSEFVNHGLLLWNQTRQQWVGNKGPQKSGQEAQEAKLSFNTIYEGLLGSNKPFPQPIPLTLVKDEERWAGGVRSSSGSTSKRTKHMATSNYSSGDTGEASEGEPQVFGGTGDPTPDEYGGSSRGPRRPQGTKAAKAARARKSRGESSQSASGSDSRGGSDTLMVAYMTATMADTSRFSYAQFAAWWNGIVHVAAQLGLPTPPQPRPPPEDD